MPAQSKKVFKEFIIISTGAQLEYVKIEDIKATYGRNATLPCPYFEKTSNVSVSFRAQSFTSLMADLHQDINRISSFSRCLNGTFP